MLEARREGDRRQEPRGGLGVEACPSPCKPLFSRQDAVLSALRAWEAQNLRALRVQETQALQEQEQEQLLTYTREDAYSAVRACPPRGSGSGR